MIMSIYNDEWSELEIKILILHLFWLFSILSFQLKPLTCDELLEGLLETKKAIDEQVKVFLLFFRLIHQPNRPSLTDPEQL